jgi:hypothetical protein
MNARTSRYHGGFRTVCRSAPVVGFLLLALSQSISSCDAESQVSAIDASTPGSGGMGDGGFPSEPADSSSPMDVSERDGETTVVCAATDAVSSSPPYAAEFGCYAPLHLPEECRELFAEKPPCVSEGGTDGVFLPEDLPCGSCDTWGQTCSLGVRPLCDCDGAGPRSSFLEPLYWDEWVCLCQEGTWQCWINAPSGSSCVGCVPDGG